MKPSHPRTIYKEKIECENTVLTELNLREDRITRLRPLVFFGSIAATFVSYRYELFSLWWLSVPAVIFLILVILHEKVLRSIQKSKRIVAYYNKALRRIDHQWLNEGIRKTSYVADNHIYAHDLDIFGEASLFQLICTARTQTGEITLAKWFSASPNAEEIVNRQKAIEELTPRVDLREDLSLLGEGIRSDVHPGTLISWGENAPVIPVRSSKFKLYKALAWVLSLGSATGLILWVTSSWGALVLLPVLVLQTIVSLFAGKKTESVTSAVQQASHELNVLASALQRLESEPYSGNKLSALHRQLTSEGLNASACISELDRLVTWLDARRNQFFAIFAFLLMWDLHFSLAIEKWRQAHGKFIRPWLDALGELEALCSLSGYAFENPENCYPQLSKDPTYFAAEQIGHPLIDSKTCVRNDIQLDNNQRIWIVSGSNMSGKSTLLRTIGINAVLAFTGAPVRAKQMELSLFNVGASIRQQDSLQTGTSRFYAEIKHLSELVKLTGEEKTLLFLIDEVFNGTNSKDRRIGAEALVKEFIERKAVGLLTTHDLALAKIADALGTQVSNVHFEDQFSEGKLSFDYKIRKGVIERSNAIELMRSVGLPV